MAIKIIKINGSENLNNLVRTLKNDKMQSKGKKKKTIKRKRNNNDSNDNMTIGNLINQKHQNLRTNKNNNRNNNSNNNMTIGNLMNKKNMGQLNVLNNNQPRLKPYPNMNERNVSKYRNHVQQVLGGITNAKVNKKTKSTNFASIINRVKNNKHRNTLKLSNNANIGNKPQNKTYSQAYQTYYQTNMNNGKKTQKGVNVFTNTKLPYNIVYEMKNNKMTKKLVHKKHMLNNN